MLDDKMRIVQELVPGKQVSIAHVIANPDLEMLKSLKIEGNGAVGILTVCPAETAIIASDLAVKASGVRVCHLDFSENGTLIVSGSVSEVQAALMAILEFCRVKLKFDVCEITKT